jgi:zinc transport system substrate-binding protein
MVAGFRALGRVAMALAVALAVGLFATTAACTSGSSDGRVTAVASMYPLAWAAERIGGNRVAVEDLTPPGVEAHDTTLTAAQRADIQTADVVVYLGQIGLQPDVERAVADAGGRVVDVTAGLHITAPAGQTFDPHVWLDPVYMEGAVRLIAGALKAVDASGSAGFAARETSTLRDLQDLDASFRAGLQKCAYTTFVVTHEAFGYLADRYGLHQLGIEGITPESEPSAARIQQAAQAIAQGRAAPAVFYEGTDAGRRIGESVSGDVGVPALPLGTLESAPSSGDYLSVMLSNLASLERGLQCTA